MMEHCKIEKRVYRWESGKLILKLQTNKYVEFKTMENWFQHRFPKNKIFKWLKNHLNASHHSDEAKRLTSAVILVKSRSGEGEYSLQFLLKE